MDQPPHFPQIFHFFERNHVKFMGSSSNVQFPCMHFPMKLITFFGVHTLFNFLYKTWAPCIDFIFTCCPISKGCWNIFPRFVNCAISKELNVFSQTNYIVEDKSPLDMKYELPSSMQWISLDPMGQVSFIHMCKFFNILIFDIKIK